uniref:Uncharacterized protein n=1 Tax=Tanacetum cinerariifolium TaxID=118510 RepID=A0A699GVN6_TANCI|nr:hypothetical protein [Tanacetum cinerariifolium]
MTNQEQNPPQQEQPFVAAKQVGFNLEDIILNPNNKVALLYPEHNNKDHFKCVSDFISKCCLRKPFTKPSNMYKEYLTEFDTQLKLLKTLRCTSQPPLVSGAKPGYKKHLNSKQYFVSNKDLTKGRSSKAPIGSKNSHSKKRKESSSTMDSNPSQPLVFIPVYTRMHKEDQQATGGLTSSRVTSEAKANPQLSSGMSAFNLNEPIYSAFFIIHYKSASGNDASAASTAKADLGNSALSDFVPQQQVMNEGTKNTSYDHLFAGTDPYVLADQTKSVSEGLKTVLTQPIIGKGASSIASQIKEETSSTIKLEDLAKLVSYVKPSFKDLDSPEDDHVIVVDDSNEDEDDEVHDTENVETKDTPVPKSLYPMSSQVQELTNQVASVQAQLKTLDAFPGLLLNVTKALNKFAQVLDSVSSKARDQSVPSAGQADIMPAEGEKNTNQATIFQFFQ